MKEKKTIKILQPIPKMGKDIVIVPFGTYLNQGLTECRPDDVIEIWQGWRHRACRIIQIAKMRINTSEFTFVMKYVYGHRFRVSGLMNKFSEWSYEAGAGIRGYDSDYCMVIEITDADEEE